ncbi:MAG: 30S ribosomal protein S8 [Chlamydiota bacterium]|nr:30S ribosomal protein S8 [Chlamydiota bacterium]
MNDPVSDMFTRIRNASSAKKEYVDIPASVLKREIARILKEESYIQDFQMAKDSKHAWIRVFMKYSRDGEPSIRGIRRVSTPGRRVYSACDKLPRVKGGLGISIISSSRGIVSWKTAKQQNIGGEVIGIVW